MFHVVSWVYVKHREYPCAHISIDKGRKNQLTSLVGQHNCRVQYFTFFFSFAFFSLFVIGPELGFAVGQMIFGHAFCRTEELFSKKTKNENSLLQLQKIDSEIESVRR